MQKTRPTSRALGFGILLVLLLSPWAIAAGPDPTTVEALAIYDAKTGSDSLPDSQVNYNVIDPGLISQILGGIEWSVARDCFDMETINVTYMYMRYLDGTRKVYHLFLHDSHISLKDNRGTCFYVDPATRTLIEDNTQP